MKKVLLCLSLSMFCLLGLAQETEDTNNLSQIKSSEIAVNLLDFVVGGAIELQYEHYLKNNHSAQLSITAFDNYGYWDLGMIDKNETHSIALAYKFYMGKKDHAGLNFLVYIKYMFGEQTYDYDDWYYDDYTGETSPQQFVIDMNNLSFGLGMGYKWVFSGNYTLGVDASVGRTFNQDISDYYSTVEFKSGISLGLRF